MSDPQERKGGLSGVAIPSAPFRPEPLGLLLEWCRGCGSSYLRAVIDGEISNILCRECGCCWHLEPGGVRRVDPRACPGCPSRPVCLRRLWETLGAEPAPPGD